MAKKELVALIERGYFPEELPPPFTTKPFASLVDKKLTDYRTKVDTKINAGWTNYCRHNLSRNGRIKRVLAICHPKHYFRLADLIQKNWTTIEKHIVSSKMTQTYPVWGNSEERALIRRYSLNHRPDKRAEVCLKARYLLKTDIERFFPSIYTHSIAWAIHSKSTIKEKLGKKSKKARLLGESIDYLVRGGQGGQTMGIPIGPDTSRVISEIVLSSVDHLMPKRFTYDGFHYVDDYEFAFNTKESANECFTSFYEALAEYELSPNLRKTHIYTLPYKHESEWLNALRGFVFVANGVERQKHNLQAFFDLLIQLSEKHEEDSVIKWAMAKLANIDFIYKKNWKFVINNVCNLVVNEPSSIEYALNLIHRFNKQSYPLYKLNLQKAFNEIIRNESSLRHSNYVAWAIWACIVFELKINSSNVKKLSRMEDVVVALLVLHAKKLKLLSGSGHRFNNWRPFMVSDELNGDKWLLSYEAKYKGWLPSYGIKDHIKSNTLFNYLRSNKVFFYDENALTAWKNTDFEKPVLPKFQEDYTDNKRKPILNLKY